MGVAEVVDPHPALQVRRLHGCVPDGVAEPVRRDVPVGVTGPHATLGRPCRPRGGRPGIGSQVCST
jgi:hypothetical protein